MSTNLDISPPKRPCPLSDLNTIDYSSSNANNSVLSASYLTDQSSSIASSTLINCSLAHHSSLNAVDQKHWFGCIVAASLKINSGYWPSLIIDPEWCNLQKPKSGTIWVYWYGTNQISQINTKNRLRSYSEIFSSSEYHKKTKSIQRAMNKAYLDLMYRNYLVVDDCCDFEAAEQQLQQTTDLLSNQNADDCLQMACLHSLEEKLGDSKSALTDLLSSQDFIKRSMVSRATLLILKKLRTNFFYKAKSFSNPDSHALNGTSMSNNCNLIGSNSSSMLIKAATDATNSLSNQSSQTSEEEMAELIRRGNSEYPINVKNHQDWLNGKLALRDVCLACWNTSVECEHPFFVGGLCQQCKDFFMESVFMISDEDGCYFYCSVCGNGGNLYVCTNDACKRVYCSSCMQTFYSDEEIKAILADDYWHCELCRETIAEETLRARSSLPMVVSKTLCMRDNWQKLLANMFLPQTYTEISFKDGMPKRELRVLSLFDGIGTGLVALDKLNIRIDKYFASEIHVDAINICKMNHGSRVTHIGDIKNIDMPK
ncbi:MAG: DNA (cytosine-5)-methyltransferase 3A, partial [Marteilia pararefringens]